MCVQNWNKVPCMHILKHSNDNGNCKSSIEKYLRIEPLLSQTEAGMLRLVAFFKFRNLS